MKEDSPATLNMIIDDVSWELFEEQIQERYPSEEFVERQLHEFDALRQGSCMVPEYEAHFWICFSMLHTLTEKVKVNELCWPWRWNSASTTGTRITGPKKVNWNVGSHIPMQLPSEED
jgi:hypothetical protein